MPRVLVAMSGGVDSSVCAALLCEQGYECIGVTMQLCKKPHGSSAEVLFYNTADVQDARDVCNKLGIRHYAFDMSEEFERDVIEPFCASYESGYTPNPCIECNHSMKFGKLLERAADMGCEFIATGHYVRRRQRDGIYTLSRAADLSKDQSYFLYTLTQEKLAHILFPLGELSKNDVRELARRYGFSNAQKCESQDICFIPDNDYLCFLEKRHGGPYPEGDIVTQDGRVVGQHRGVAGYTIGQRKGLGVALHERAYVCAKDVQTNTITLGPPEALMARSCLIEGWTSVAPPTKQTLRVTARTHYRHRDQPACLVMSDEHHARLDFDCPQRAMTPGQAAVAYIGDEVVGGGIIRSTLP